ncbi:MAG: transglutaminase domain-containing protein [Kofleriaceae bacterium]
MRIAGWLVAKTLKAAWVALMIATPLFGFWLASSLAAYQNASQWLALVIGLLLFPLVPVGWELVFEWRRDQARKPILTRLDRLVLRTLIINGLFLGAMLWRAPELSFRALAVRGDWILDGQAGPVAQQARELLLGFADHFASRWHKDTTTFGTSDKPPPEHHDDTTPPPPIPGMPVQPKDPNGWPLPEQPDELATSIPDADQTDVATVARYFATRITDPHRLAKALHDYVVLRLTYDTPTSLLKGEDLANRPSQQADAVFAARTAVCEGYARLYAALGKDAGLEVAFVTGYIRDAHRRPSENAVSDEAVKQALEGFLHAWNAVKLDGQWALVDPTWDDPVSSDGKSNYSTTYLFTPPSLFAYDHLPEEPAWQLVAKPLGAGEFARQPLLSPYVGRIGVVLQDPARSQVTVDDGELDITFGNPFHASLDAMVDRAPDGCTTLPSDSLTTHVKCRVTPGQREIQLFGAPGEHASQLRYFGSILVNSR